ncbi:DUF2256 domain-containing protein [Arenimonas metalli]|uniref:DUF2256 domain-containing protein n=1 Tax=Arenimonas metalli TaxID=948077 RepID=UPI003CCBA1B3
MRCCAAPMPRCTWPSAPAATASPPMAAERRSPGAPRPEKTCPVCQRPFQWRKKWERDWDRVVYCSDACRRGTPRGRAG